MKTITLFFLLLLSQLTIADIQNQSNTLFDWAEKNYAHLFSPSQQKSQIMGQYYYRYYPNTGNYIGVDITELDVYVSGQSFESQSKVDSLNNLTDFAQLIFEDEANNQYIPSLTTDGRNNFKKLSPSLNFKQCDEAVAYFENSTGMRVSCEETNDLDVFISREQERTLYYTFNKQSGDFQGYMNLECQQETDASCVKSISIFNHDQQHISYVVGLFSISTSSSSWASDNLRSYANSYSLGISELVKLPDEQGGDQYLTQNFQVYHSGYAPYTHLINLTQWAGHVFGPISAPLGLLSSYKVDDKKCIANEEISYQDPNLEEGAMDISWQDCLDKVNQQWNSLFPTINLSGMVYPDY